MEDVDTQTLFENEYVRTKEVHCELIKWAMSKQIISQMFALLIIAALITAHSLFVSTGISVQIIIMLIVLVLFMVVITVVQYKQSLKLSCKRDLEVGGDTPIRVKFAFDDNMIHMYRIPSQGETPLSDGHVEYYNIKKAAITKNLIILASDAKLPYVIKKDGFTKGNLEKFLAFLRTRGIAV